MWNGNQSLLLSLWWAGRSSVLRRNKVTGSEPGQERVRRAEAVCCEGETWFARLRFSWLLKQCCGRWPYRPGVERGSGRDSQESPLPDGEICLISKGVLPIGEGFPPKAPSPVSHASSHPPASWHGAGEHAHTDRTTVKLGSIPHRTIAGSVALWKGCLLKHSCLNARYKLQPFFLMPLKVLGKKKVEWKERSSWRFNLGTRRREITLISRKETETG